MNRSQAIELLRQSKATLSGRYGVTRLALFGSLARDAAREDSDADILVAFDGPPGDLAAFFRRPVLP